MISPTIESRGSYFIFYWRDKDLKIRVSRINTHKDRTTCEILAETTAPEYSPHILHSTLNLTSSRVKSEIAHKIATYYDKVSPEEADDIIEQLCIKTLHFFRSGEPAIDLHTFEETPPITYKVYPLIAENEINIIFGDGGTGKSIFVLALAILIQLPWENNHLQLPPRMGRVLWLDWETSWATTARRLKLLTEGFKLPAFFIKYRRCLASLADDLEAIHQICLENEIDTIIIDSLGMACGGDMNAAEVATKFFSAFRTLNCTGILIHHASKEQMKTRVKKPTPIGSVYFYNLARQVWECRAVQEYGSNNLSIGLFHRKSNISHLHAPLAYTITFEKTQILIDKSNINNIPEFAIELSLPKQIMNLLISEKRPMDRNEIALTLNAKTDSVKRALTRLREAGKIVSLENNKWGLSTQGCF